MKRYRVTIHDKSRTIYLIDAPDADQASTNALMIWQAQRPPSRQTPSFTSWVQSRDLAGVSVTDIEAETTINTEAGS